jgi:hypothetical protein
MAEETKLMLSDVELRFVKDTNWVLTKHRIIDKVYDLLNAQVAVIAGAFGPVLHSGLQPVTAAVPKITKGEKYRLLPYVILDYPSVFNKEDIFALRTMFWWGNFVSITLQVAGKYKQHLLERIMAGIQRDPSGLFICINDEQWAHHFEPGNYLQAKEMTYAEINAVFRQAGFIKLAIKYELEKWNELPALLQTGYQQIARLLAG